MNVIDVTALLTTSLQEKNSNISDIGKLVFFDVKSLAKSL